MSRWFSFPREVSSREKSALVFANWSAGMISASALMLAKNVFYYFCLLYLDPFNLVLFYSNLWISKFCIFSLIVFLELRVVWTGFICCLLVPF